MNNNNQQPTTFIGHLSEEEVQRHCLLYYERESVARKQNFEVVKFTPSESVMIYHTVISKVNAPNSCDILHIAKQDAIDIAIAILKGFGILPTITTIAELEKQGKI